MLSVKDGFKIRMQSEKVTEMEFNGTVGSSPWEDDAVSASDVISFLKDMGSTETLRIYFNSPGGDVYDGFQIANRLDQMRSDGRIGTIEAYGEAQIYSAATLPFLKADKRFMRNGSRFMIHEPWALDIGNSTSHREAADRLDQTTEQALDLYEAVASLDRDEILAAMKATTFYSPRQAVDAGFATEVIDQPAIAMYMSQGLRARYADKLPEDMKILDPRDREEEPKEIKAAITSYPEWLENHLASRN